MSDSTTSLILDPCEAEAIALRLGVGLVRTRFGDGSRERGSAGIITATIDPKMDLWEFAND